MSDAIDIFLGEIKCKLQLFNPKPGDVFVLTIPGEISFEEEQRLRDGFLKYAPENKMAVVIGAVAVALEQPTAEILPPN